MFYSWVSCIIPHDMQLRMFRTSPYGPYAEVAAILLPGATSSPWKRSAVAKMGSVNIC
jgi:hypothetical protein